MTEKMKKIKMLDIKQLEEVNGGAPGSIQETPDSSTDCNQPNKNKDDFRRDGGVRCP